MEKDITGKAVEQSATIVANVLERIKQKVPLGPGQVKMSQEELKAEIAKMRGEPLLRMVDALGKEEVMNALRNRDA